MIHETPRHEAEPGLAYPQATDKQFEDNKLLDEFLELSASTPGARGDYRDPTNIKAGYEAVNEKPDGEPQEEYDRRTAKLRETFGQPAPGPTLEEQREIAIREAIISTAIHAPKQPPPA